MRHGLKPVRPASPPLGFSTLAMSAPIQASASVHVVPASNCVRSSTRIPARQPGDTGVTSIEHSLPGSERSGGDHFIPIRLTGRSSTVIIAEDYRTLTFQYGVRGWWLTLSRFLLLAEGRPA